MFKIFCNMIKNWLNLFAVVALLYTQHIQFSSIYKLDITIAFPTMFCIIMPDLIHFGIHEYFCCTDFKNEVLSTLIIWSPFVMNSRNLQANIVWIYPSWRFLLITDLDDPFVNEYFNSLFKNLIVVRLKGILPKFSLIFTLNIVNCNRFRGWFHKNLHICLLKFDKLCRIFSISSPIIFYSFWKVLDFH